MPDNGLGWPENHSDMHCAIATLTTGPVTFGDKPGLENRDLLMKCCREDGKILKPDRAISAIDSQIRNLGIVFLQPNLYFFVFSSSEPLKKLMGAIDIEHGPGTTPFFNDTVAEDRWNVQGQVRMRTVSQSTSSGLNIFLRSGRHILMLESMNMESSLGDRSSKIISFTKGTELN